MVMGKSSKAIPIEVDCEWVVGNTQGIDTHIKLPPSKQKRVEDISLADVVFSRNILIGSLPLADVADLVEDEDALPLAF